MLMSHFTVMSPTNILLVIYPAGPNVNSVLQCSALKSKSKRWQIHAFHFLYKTNKLDTSDCLLLVSNRLFVEVEI